MIQYSHTSVSVNIPFLFSCFILPITYRIISCSPLIIPFLQLKAPVYLFFFSCMKVVSYWSSLLVFLHFPVHLFFGGGMTRVPLTIKDFYILWIIEISVVSFWKFLFSLLVNGWMLNYCFQRFSADSSIFFSWVAVVCKYRLNVHVLLRLFFFYILGLIYQ